MHTRTVLLLLLALLSACAPAAPVTATPSATAPLPTVAPTGTPRPSPTPAPPEPTATIAPVPGLAVNPLNLRDRPDTAGQVLAVIPAGTALQIVGQDRTGTWWQVLYPSAPDGYGWVTAAFVQTSGTPAVPVIGALPTGGPGSITARVLQKLNVRSGPGTNYNALGVLNPDETVTLTGKNATGTWLQILYPGGPGGRGWVTAAFIQVADTASLPVLDEFGTPVAAQQTGTPGTPGAPAPTATATVLPASDDGDSLQSPGADVILRPAGTRRFQYVSEVSAPDGDLQDWVRLQVESAIPGADVPVSLSLACRGNGQLEVELWLDGARLDGWGRLECDRALAMLRLSPGRVYTLRLSVAPDGGLRYVHYELSAAAGP